MLEAGRPYFSVELGYREIPPNLAESYHVAERSESSSSGAEAYPIATGYDFSPKGGELYVELALQENLRRYC